MKNQKIDSPANAQTVSQRALLMRLIRAEQRSDALRKAISPHLYLSPPSSMKLWEEANTFISVRPFSSDFFLVQGPYKR